MLFIAKRVLVKYKSLVVRMNDDLGMIEVAKPTFEFSCDVKVVMGFMCIMPMLEVVHDLIKFAQKSDTFVCDFVGVMKMCCAHLHTLYYDPKNKYINEQFKGFANLIICNNDELLIAWWIDATTNIENVFFTSKANNSKSIPSASHQGLMLCALAMLGLMLQKE